MTLPEHVKQNDHFSEVCGVPSPNNGKVDYALTTKCGQGNIFYENGDHDFVAKGTSKEVVGKNITNENTPAKIIRAENGGIILSAPYGTVTIVAANIRFVAVDGVDGGEITFQASKIINMDAPTVNTQGTNITIAASQTASVAGTTADINGGTQVTVSSGVDADSSSVLGQIVQAIKRFQKFFDSIVHFVKSPICSLVIDSTNRVI
jgi:hypothetical protein